ncbi:MAG: hypothetical protein ABI885_26875 [Gammaproteobacteria bacterium]
MNLHKVLQSAMWGVMTVVFCAAVYAAAEPASPSSAPEAPEAPAAVASVPGAAAPKGQFAALDALPDWGGIWTLNFPAPGAKRATPALKGNYLAEYQKWQKESEARHGMGKKAVSNCTPPGMPYLMAVGQYPIEFLFTPGRVTVHHEAWMQWRFIFTDGRMHPDTEPSFNGHSIGHWEGNTLVVDTVGVKTTVPLGPGMSHSDKLHLVERIHLDAKDPDTLLVELTVDDPVALEKPYTNTLSFARSRDSDLLEFICAENDRNPVDEAGDTQFQN